MVLVKLFKANKLVLQTLAGAVAGAAGAGALLVIGWEWTWCIFFYFLSFFTNFYYR